MITTLNISSGENYLCIITFTDKNGVAVDLSNLSAARLRVKADPADDDSAAIIDKELNLLDPSNDLADGKLAIRLTDTETKVAAGNYLWDCRCERSSGTSPFYFPKPSGVCNVLAVISQEA